MKTIKLIALFFFMFVSCASNAAVVPASSLQPSYDLKKISIKEIERISGKKLSLFQKIKLKVLLKTLRNTEEGSMTEKQEKQAKASQILGIASLILMFLSLAGIGFIAILCIPAAVIAIILGAKSRKGNSNKKGKIGIITGALTLGIIILFTLLLLILNPVFFFE